MLFFITTKKEKRSSYISSIKKKTKQNTKPRTNPHQTCGHQILFVSKNFSTWWPGWEAWKTGEGRHGGQGDAMSHMRAAVVPGASMHTGIPGTSSDSHLPLLLLPPSSGTSSLLGWSPSSFFTAQESTTWWMRGFPLQPESRRLPGLLTAHRITMITTLLRKLLHTWIDSEVGQGETTGVLLLKLRIRISYHS